MNCKGEWRRSPGGRPGNRDGGSAHGRRRSFCLRRSLYRQLCPRRSPVGIVYNFFKKKFTFFKKNLNLWIVWLANLSIRIFLTLITLNLWSNLSLGQTSWSVIHPQTTPPPARLTFLFHSDEFSRSKLYLVDNTTISILLTLISLYHTSLVLNFQTIY
jgi:hypothetical protein